MIALAANGFLDLYTLLDSDNPPPVDFIKCPLSPNSQEEVERALKYRPVLLHCWGPPGYSVTRPSIPEPELLSELVSLTQTPFLSVHLDYQPVLDGVLDRTTLLDHIRSQVDELRRISGRPILIENVPWYPWMNRPSLTSDPDFISEVIRENEAELLLDIAHARVAAFHRQEPIEEYLDRLPLDRAREIHVSGPRMTDEGLRDVHMSLREEDYRVIALALNRAPGVEHLTLEYAGAREKTAHFRELDGPELLAAQLHELDDLRSSLI